MVACARRKCVRHLIADDRALQTAAGISGLRSTDAFEHPQPRFGLRTHVTTRFDRTLTLRWASMSAKRAAAMKVVVP